MTYSLVARDPDTGALGVGVQSHFFGVGRIVTWAEAGTGVVATQSFAEPGYGPRGLSLMRDGATAREALETLVSRDHDAEVRQVGMVDSLGGAASYTGERCVAEAGHVLGEQAAAQANMMTKDTVWNAMIEAVADQAVPFVERLVRALEAAESEGGDIRGKQSAALLVVGGRRSDTPWNEIIVDVRVDDHPEPLRELRRLVAYNRAYELLGRALFTPGVVTGEFTADEPALDDALAGLAEAQEILSENPEPTLWRGVLLARAGRLQEAHEGFLDAARRNPALVEFARRLPAAGLLPENAETLGRILPPADGPARAGLPAEAADSNRKEPE